MAERTTRQGLQGEWGEPLRQAAALLEHEPVESLRKVERLIASGLTDASAHGLHARALIAVERFLDAAAAAERALDAGDMSQQVLSLRLHALSHGGDYADLERVVELGMTQPRLEYRNLLAMAQSARLLGQSALAIRLYGLLIRSRPDEAMLLARQGVVHESRGEMALADQCFRDAIGRDPAAASSRYLLSCLKRQTTDENNLSALHEAWTAADSADIATAHQRACLAYALGKEHEDLERYSQAFSWYARGARTERSRIAYSAADDAFLYQGIKALEHRLPDSGAEGFSGERPIFIVGLPRTGSTLIDTMLSRHTRVACCGELPAFREALKQQLAYEDGRHSLRQLIDGGNLAIDFRALGERYVAMARTRMTRKLCFTDKMPGNHLLLGFISRALPKARIIIVDRQPADSCMSAFKQLFAPGSYPWSYDLEEAARHCLLHRDLTRFWMERMPGRILRVAYEELVTHPEDTERKILAFCGLDWEDACLDPDASRGAVNTASAAQVRLPVYTTSVGRWRRYETELQPALRILAEEEADTRRFFQRH